MESMTKNLLLASRVDGYNRWIFEKIAPFLGSRILEIGSGIGTFTQFLLDKPMVFAMEISSEYIQLLNKRFSTFPNISVERLDIVEDDLKGFVMFNFDTALCLNVLEHLKDDIKALRNIHSVLTYNGRVILLVPSIKALFGATDRAVDHVCRYSRKELEIKLKEAGFLIEKIFPMNFIGIPAWFINSRLLKRKSISSGQLGLYNFMLPFFRKLESILMPPVGLSLIGIGKKR